MTQDDEKRPGLDRFRWPGLGVYMTRTCGKCGKPRENKGGQRHKVLGWIGDCCVKTKGETK